ncbi:Methyltransferase domain-containing protein [Bacteroides luti]|uniref:Methyltransferase domain-containing protein n=1 Tax=Bacteroides luti TaxID=1297750 RepID=A0A1M4YV00_9BACE|nr:class I SAM-dependent methyltransferase [Bacteroides luti]SHF09629.1 Methyltransferase domain-containing protein [Bacteroides luti]
MNKLTINTCPLCGGTHLVKKMTCTDFYASGEQFDLLQCENCGFQFTQGFPVEKEIGKYYETPDYISHSDTKKGMMNELYHLVRSRMLQKKAQLINNITGKTSGKILDIGTGTGYFSHTMQQKGWQVEAIEKSAQARSFAKKNFNLDIKDDSGLNDFSSGSFDVITLWHVMEHLEHLNETWERLHELLKDDGCLVVAVPNCSSYDAQKYKEFWAAYDVPRHLWHFTPDSIKKFGEKHNFTLVNHLPMPFDAFYVSILSEKYKESKSSLVKGMFAGTLAWFSSLSNKEKSSSIIYVFRKKGYEK